MSEFNFETLKVCKVRDTGHTISNLKQLKNGDTLISDKGHFLEFLCNENKWKIVHNGVCTIRPILVKCDVRWLPIDVQGNIDVNWCGSCPPHKLHWSTFPDDTPIKCADVEDGEADDTDLKN